LYEGEMWPFTEHLKSKISFEFTSISCFRRKGNIEERKIVPRNVCFTCSDNKARKRRAKM